MSKSWMEKKEPPRGGPEKSWNDCGYVTLSKNGNVLSIVIKHQRYVVNLKEAAEVVDGQRNYALVFEFVGEKMIPFKNLPKQRVVKICPRCGSDKVSKHVLPFPDGAKDSKKLECDECGKIFPEGTAEFVLMELKESG